MYQIFALMLLFLTYQEIFAQSKKIYLVHWQKAGRTLAGETFINYLKTKYNDIEFIERFANHNQTKLPGFVSEIRKINPDLIYVFSTTGILEVAGEYDNIDPKKHITDIPIIAVAQSDPLGSKVVKELDAPTGRNVTGVSHYIPATTMINVTKAYASPLQKIVILISHEPNSISIAKEIKGLEKEMEFESRVFFHKMKGIEVDLNAMNEIVVEILNEKPDVIYLCTDGLNTAYIETIVATFIQHQQMHAAPIFTTSERMLVPKKSATFGIFISFYSMGLMAAVKAEEILFQGKKITEVPYSVCPQVSIAIRRDTMNALKTYPHISLLEITTLL